MNNTKLLNNFQCEVCKMKGRVSLVYESATVKLDVQKIGDSHLYYEDYSPEIPDYNSVKFTCSNCNNLIFYIEDIHKTEQEILVDFLKGLENK